MKFWDTSAIVPLVLREASTPTVHAQLAEDAGMIVWWATCVEAVSAFVRVHRELDWEHDRLEEAINKLDELMAAAIIIQPTDEVGETARKVLLTHQLRAADALQLAAALIAVEQQAAGEGFVSLDHRLRAAAAGEGFAVFPFDGA